MASIRKRGNSYLIVVSMGYDKAGNRKRPVQKTFHLPDGLTPKQAEKWLSEQALLFEREVKHTKQPIDPKMTLADYIAIWLRDVAPNKLALSTIERDKSDIRLILPHLGNYKLTELTKEILREFYDEMRKRTSQRTGKPLAEKTVAGMYATLSGILSDAMDAGYLEHNPAWRSYKPKGKKKEKFIADAETVRVLIRALEKSDLKYELYFKLILATGIRRGECCGIKWEDIDWQNRSIRICRNIVSVPHVPIFEKEPKTAAGDRTVYFSEEMKALLEDYQKHSSPSTLHDFLFRQKNGLPMNPDTFTSRFNRILKQYGLPTELTIHSLRHTNASILISEGVDVRTVAALLGHAQPSTTLDIYAHAFDKKKREAGEKVQGVIGV